MMLFVIMERWNEIVMGEQLAARATEFTELSFQPSIYRTHDVFYAVENDMEEEE